MRWPRATIALLTAVLLAAAAAPSVSARAAHDEFAGLYFPAGMPGTGTDCPYTWVDPAFCVIDPGTWTAPADGRLRIRDMRVFELALAWSADDPTQVEPRKTGYDVVTANANLDATMSGPAWGTWMLYSFADELMFTGTFTGTFENGIPAVHFVGRGSGQYQGQHMWGDIGRVPNPYNMFGQILETGSE
jgi:hypothetical protein